MSATCRGSCRLIPLRAPHLPLRWVRGGGGLSLCLERLLPRPKQILRKKQKKQNECSREKCRTDRSAHPATKIPRTGDTSMLIRAVSAASCKNLKKSGGPPQKVRFATPENIWVCPGTISIRNKRLHVCFSVFCQRFRSYFVDFENLIMFLPRRWAWVVRFLAPPFGRSPAVVSTGWALMACGTGVETGLGHHGVSVST